MKSIWKYLVGLADSLARARAAAELTRLGRRDLAQKIMLRD